MKTAIRLLVLAAGLAVFAWFVRQAGLREVWENLSRLGWRAPLILVPLAVVYAAETLGWLLAFGSRHRPGLPFRTLYRVRWCGESVNNVVPSGTVGGEALKVYLLHKRGVNPGDAAASVIVGRTVQTLMQVTFIGLGAAAFLRIAADRPGLRAVVGTVLALCLTLIALLFWMQAHGMFSIVFKWAALLHLPLRALESRRERLLQVDRQVLGFYRTERTHFILSGAMYLTAWLLDTLDVLLVSWLLGMPVAWLYALAIEALIGVAKFAGFLVPGGLGVQETGITLITRLVGLPPALGIAYAIIRRGRDVAFAGVGWLMLSIEEASLRSLRSRVEAEAGPEVP